MKKLIPRMKTQKFASTCEGDAGVCRKKCKESETVMHYCLNNKICCVKSSSTVLTGVIEDTEWSKVITTTSQPFYWRSSPFAPSGNLPVEYSHYKVAFQPLVSVFYSVKIRDRGEESWVGAIEFGKKLQSRKQNAETVQRKGDYILPCSSQTVKKT